MTSELVVLEPGRIATLRLDNPPLNLITQDLTAQLKATLRVLEESSETHCVVVAGSSRAFSAGSDVNEFASLQGRVGEGKLIEENVVYDMLAGLAVPTIAAIEGDAIGGGLELALCCDLRIASKGARLGLPEARLGVIPGSGGIQRLPRLIGLAKAKEMILLGELIDGTEAARLGLVNRATASGEAEPTASRMAQSLLERGPLALREAKALLNGALDLSHDAGQAEVLDASERVFSSADMIEGVAAFKEKRSPRFEAR